MKTLEMKEATGDLIWDDRSTPTLRCCLFPGAEEAAVEVA
jgi:hypothetical protein